jgi:hypothetical protein
MATALIASGKLLHSRHSRDRARFDPTPEENDECLFDQRGPADYPLLIGISILVFR